MKRIKIAIDTSFMDRRPAMGTAVFIRKLVEHLRPYRNQLDITLVHQESIPEDPLYSEFKELVIPKIKLPKFSDFFSELVFFLKHRGEFDIYHFGHYRIRPTAIFTPGLKKITIQYDGGPASVDSANATSKESWFDRLLWRLYSRIFDAFIVTSQFGKDAIIRTRRIPKNKVYVLYGGVDSIFSPLKKEKKEEAKERLAQKYNIGGRFIVASGRLDPHKNILSLVRAYKILKDQYDIFLPLVATGGFHMPEYSRQVFSEIDKLGLKDQFIILKIEEFKDMPIFYGLAELMVFPSLREGFGLPLVEAMACGTPTVAARATSLIEVGGNATRFVNPLSPEDIAKGIEEVLNNQEIRHRLIVGGFEQAKKFTWENHVADTVRLYYHLLE